MDRAPYWEAIWSSYWDKHQTYSIQCGNVSITGMPPAHPMLRHAATARDGAGGGEDVVGWGWEGESIMVIFPYWLGDIGCLSIYIYICIICFPIYISTCMQHLFIIKSSINIYIYIYCVRIYNHNNNNSRQRLINVLQVPATSQKWNIAFK